MQVSILGSIYTDDSAEFRTSYPVNMVPVPKVTGISSGFLRPAEGAIPVNAGPGIPRGGIVWNDVCYRVMGTKLISIAADNTIAILGDVGAAGVGFHTQCTFAYSFDKLAITSGGRLYYWDGAALTQVTDPDLGDALSVIWVDGYFMTTDGEFLVVTELSDPFAVNPLKYGSSEIDPDPVVAVAKLRNEVCAVNRHTIEFFENIGGSFFPFSRIAGAQLQKGAVGPHAICNFAEHIAFIGSGRGEPPGIYFGALGSTTKLSSREIDSVLASYTADQLSNAVLESRVNAGHQYLWVRLPDRTMVYDLESSAIIQQPVWHYLTSAAIGFSQHRIVDLLWCYDKWNVADITNGELGELTDQNARHFGFDVRWEFGTNIAYNEGRGALIHSIELVCLTGRTEFGVNGYVSTAYSVDGVTWSLDRPIYVGARGDRTRRLVWFQQGHMQHWRIQRFTGNSNAFITAARLEVALEPLAV